MGFFDPFGMDAGVVSQVSADKQAVCDGKFVEFIVQKK